MSKPYFSGIFPIQSIVLYPIFNTGDGKDSNQFYSLNHRSCPSTIISLSNDQIVFLLNMTDITKHWGL